MSKYKNGLLVAVIILLLAVIGGMVWMFNREVLSIRQDQAAQTVKHEETNQFLLSTIDWSTQRQRTILFMRDMVVREWEIMNLKVDYEKAYRRAEAILNESEKYPGVRPLFMLAIQRVESRFQDSLVSVMGAIGPWQLMPSTGRLLCDAMNLSYSEKYLYDLAASTKLAGKLIGILWVTYGDEAVVAADYNGGPWQAHFYKTDRAKLVPETSNFVKDVKAYSDQYEKDFSTYKADATLMRRKIK